MLKQTTSNYSLALRAINGYTLIEVLVITIILGVLAAVAAPSWFGFLEKQKLNEAHGEIFRALQEGRQQATQQATSWQVSFREATVNGETVLQWRSEDEVDPDPDFFLNGITGGWNSLGSSIALDVTNTTLEADDTGNPTAWRTQFDYQGRALGDDGVYNGKVTITSDSLVPSEKRCVIISTILGAMRQAKNSDCE